MAGGGGGGAGVGTVEVFLLYGCREVVVCLYGTLNSVCETFTKCDDVVWQRWW